MAATTAIAFAAGSTIYSAVSSNQQRQKAKGDAAAILRSAPDAKTAEQTANNAAIAAAKGQRQKTSGATGRQSTILTGSQGQTNQPAPQRQTLLGL